MKRLVNKIKFFFKKLSISEVDYDQLLWKSECYKKIMGKIFVTSETTYVSTSGKVRIRFPMETTYTISINIPEMLEAGGVIFDGDINIIKWDIKT